jgi:thioredoxin reductase (NADPH)
MLTPEQVYETIILGSGPAGLTAAIYAARSRCCPLLIQGIQPGGQLTTTTTIDNFPGFAEGIEGPILMQAMEKQAARFGTRFLPGLATRVELHERPLRLWIGTELYRTITLIIATGASPKMLGLPNEWSLYGRGVSVCATCDGFFYRENEVVVVGGGDTAIEDALFLARFAQRVTVVHRRDSLRATPTLQHRAMANKKIFFRWETQITAILGDSQTGVRGVTLRHVPSGRTEDLRCDGVFIAIGHVPNTSLFTGQLDMDQEGYIITHNHTETNIPGVFAAGDVQDPHFRQAVTAAGSGCMAAMQAERYLESVQPRTKEE